MYNDTYYTGMSPMYEYGMNNSYYNYGMGMGMMGPMIGCPMMGGYGSMYNYGSSNYYSNNPNMNMTAANVDSQVVFLANNMEPEASQQNNQATSTISPLLVAGIGIGLLALAPLSWKILQRYKN